MRCQTCRVVFEPTEQSLICPHPKLDALPAPSGGFRFPPEARDGIEIALSHHDLEALNNYRYHRNPLVRAYAVKVFDAYSKEAACQNAKAASEKS